MPSFVGLVILAILYTLSLQEAADPVDSGITEHTPVLLSYTKILDFETHNVICRRTGPNTCETLHMDVVGIEEAPPQPTCAC